METIDYINFLVNEIHTTILATVNEQNQPVTCAIDIMDGNENGLYFLTARGKNFYSRLKNNNAISLTGMKGESTLKSVAISLQGKAKEIGSERIEELFSKNPYMYEIYPNEESRKILTVFHIFEGRGEFFDLREKIIQRASFNFGLNEDCTNKENIYFITKTCTACGLCVRKCPQNCISLSSIPAVIQQENCLRCGYCMEICREKAIIKGE